MADELKNKLYVIGAIVGLLITASGAWTSVVLRGAGIKANTDTNDSQQKVLTVHTGKLVTIESDIRAHNVEAIQRQKNIEILQQQVTEGIKQGNDRYIEILKRLPK